MGGERNGDKGITVLPVSKPNPLGLLPKLFRGEPLEGDKKGQLRMIPPRLVTADEAVEELNRFLPGQGNANTRARLRFPDKVKMRLYPWGIEIYDEFSERPGDMIPSSDESVLDMVQWVHHWGVAFVRKDDRIIGRFIDFAFPGRKCKPFQMPVHDPDSEEYSLERFLRTIESGVPY